MTEIMLFPINAIVLPDGVVKLRIFESRYRRLVRIASMSAATFGVCLYDVEEQNISKVGTLVRIVDYEWLSGGVLGLSVVGEQRFEIETLRHDYDGLRWGKVNYLPSWSMQSDALSYSPLVKKLEALFINIPQLAQHYDERRFDDISWVVQRWLELLPLAKKESERLLKEEDGTKALEYVMNAVSDKNCRLN